MDLNTETSKVSLDHTFPLSLQYSTDRAFKSHVKSSHADLFHSSMLLVPVRSASLRLNFLRQSQSHIATDDQSVSKSWYRAPSRARDEICIIF
jgi:hypothetical protein